MQPLDDIFVRSPSSLSRGIAWFTRGRHEGPTLATHQIKAVDTTSVVQAHKGRGVYRMDWDDCRIDLMQRGCEYLVARYVGPYRGRVAIAIGQRFLMQSIGWKYSVLEIPLQAIDGIIAKIRKRPRHGWDTVVFRHLGKLWKKGVVCSSTANRPNIHIRWLPGWLKYGSPDDTLDHVLGSKDWVIVDETNGFRKGDPMS